jgi:glycerol-3-phosphate cytidylyltransferase-like family protein
LKKKLPYNDETERKFMIESIKYVEKVYINSGFGKLDFIKEINDIKPNIFIVNEDGESFDKKSFCSENNIQYIVLKRTPHDKLPFRSTTLLKKICNIPFRIDLSGGFLFLFYNLKGWYF